jgi:hypothetical protein
MIFIETTNISEARRARRIQFSGLATKFELDGVSYSGTIVAVRESGRSNCKVWTVQCRRTQSVAFVANIKPRPIKVSAR